MSMLDSFFNKGFKGAKCKTLLKLTIPRIKLLRNKRDIQLKQMRKDIAKLLENGQEATARIRVEHIIREENMMAAQEIIELFCELIAVRIPIIETQRECPLDLKEAISSICFAAPRCADLPELQQIQMLFASKYGREFVAAASELMPNCGVNRQVIELLSIRAPPVEAKLKLLKEIAEEHEIDWDPAPTESELLKPHEDLLNGPNQFTITMLPLPTPKEIHEDYIPSEHKKDIEESDSDSGMDTLNFPEVPKASVRTVANEPSAPEIFPLQPDQIKSTHSNDEPEVVDSESSVAVTEEFNNQFFSSSSSSPAPENFSPQPEQTESTYSSNEEPKVTEQFENPFVSSSASPLVTPSPAPEIISSPIKYSLQPEQTKSTYSSNEDPNFTERFENPFVSSTPSPLTPSPAPEMFSSPLKYSPQPECVKITPYDNEERNAFQQDDLYQSKYSGVEVSVDLQDVLAAAQDAADSAERAAAAARAAASLAQVRITELTARKKSPEHSHPQDLNVKPTFDQDSFGYADAKEQQAHEPQRLSSIEDDTYLSYPNLFSRQDSNLSAEHAKPLKF